MNTPPWLQAAHADIGLREIPGAATAPRIAAWLADLRAWWHDDETPWCGTAVAAWMRSAGVSLPKHWYRAMGWLDWGVPIAQPSVGCVVVFSRTGGGHVGLVVGRDTAGRLLVLGGNQGDAVCIAPFDPARVAGYRWPAEHIATRAALPLPVTVASGAASRNEA